MVSGAPLAGVRLGRDGGGGRGTPPRPRVTEVERGDDVEHTPHTDRADPGELGHFSPLLADPTLEAPDVRPVGGSLPDPIVVR